MRHPARFVLIGSGNPEEGELRPQLLDRFGMSVEVRTVRDPELRVQVVDQRTSFDSDPDGFSTAADGGDAQAQVLIDGDLAAFEGRTEVSEEDVARVASCCLRHRLRKDPLEQVDSGDRVVKVFCKVFERSESSDRADFELALAA